MMQRSSIFVTAAILGAVLLAGLPVESAAASSGHYANCTSLHHKYAHGVGKSSARDHVSGKAKPVTNFYRSNSVYSANKGLDRDKDGVACEAH
jgi:hypothetical protein